MHTRLHQQGKMGIGTKAPVGDQNITRVQVRMEPDHLGEIMGMQNLDKKQLDCGRRIEHTLPPSIRDATTGRQDGIGLKLALSNPVEIV
jgi:hypothetical protein